MNLADDEVEDLLFRLTFLPENQIREVINQATQQPEKRLGQTLLAQTVVDMVHGEKALDAVKGSTGAFFSASIDEIL